MSEYYPHHHDHAKRTNERLNQDLSILRETRNYAQGERRTQINKEMSYIAFELSERTREAYGVSIEEAWHELSA